MTGMSGPRLMSVGRSEAYHRLYWLPVGIQDCLLSPAGPRRSLTFRREHSSCLSAQRRRFASPGSTNTLRNTLKSVMKLGVPPQSRRSGHSSTVATGRRTQCQASRVVWACEDAEKADKVLALGKFDAMHRGHRCLIQAASKMGGQPYLLSLWGMGEVLGLPTRKPLTAPPDRHRVLETWASHCGGVTAVQLSILFSSIRDLSPQDFVRALVDDLGVAGVVAGPNYRFGYRAAGDAALLQELGAQHGLRVQIVELQPALDEDLGSSSSTKVRNCLTAGQVKPIISFLERPYSLVVPNDAILKRLSSSPDAGSLQPHIFEAVRCTNQVPADGEYQAVAYVGADALRLDPQSQQSVTLSVCYGVCTLRTESEPLELSGEYCRLELLTRLDA